MIAGNLEECFTAFQFLQNQACLRVVIPTPSLTCDKLYFISCLLYCVRRIVKLLILLCRVSIFNKTFNLSMFLNNTVSVWPLNYVFRLININTYIQSKTVYFIQQCYILRSIRPNSGMNDVILKQE
jgi:hypothetical protein